MQPDAVVVGGGGGRPTQMMNPMDAIMSCLKGSMSFEGRASRSEYWWFYLFTMIVNVILGVIEGATGLPVSLAIILLLPATLSAAARRIHDGGKSGWFMLIPIYNLILCIMDGEGGDNAYGAPPTNMP